MLIKETIETRKLKLVELVLTMTPQNKARKDRLEQIAICDMALAHLQAQEQEPVAWMFDQAMYSETDVRGRGWILMFATDDPKHPTMTRNVTPLFAAPVPPKSEWVKCSDRLPELDKRVIDADRFQQYMSDNDPESTQPRRARGGK